jgi:hypothetical protein
VSEMEDWTCQICRGSERLWRLTFFHTVLLRLTVVFDLACYALDTLVVVVLGGVAFFGLGAFWETC